MKAQIIGYEFTRTSAFVIVLLPGDNSKVTIDLPTDTVLTKERLIEKITADLKALQAMREKLALLEAMQSQEVDIDL